jgi:hypothetical protein
MNCIKVYWKVRKRIPNPQIQWTTSPPSSMDKLVMHALDSFNRTLSHSVAFPANFWPSSLSSHPFLLVLGNPLFRPWWLLGPLAGRGPSQATAPDRLHPWSMVYGSLPSKMGDMAYPNKSTGIHDGFGYTMVLMDDCPIMFNFLKIFQTHDDHQDRPNGEFRGDLPYFCAWQTYMLCRSKDESWHMNR